MTRSGTKSGYSSSVDVDGSTVRDNAVIEIDGHVLDSGDVTDYPDEFSHPKITPATLELIEDELRNLGHEQFAAELKTKRFQIVENPQSSLYFRARTLSELACNLTVALAKTREKDEFETTHAITQFGKAIIFSDTDLLANSIQYEPIPNVKPTDDDSVSVDPFAAIADNQEVVIVDDQGNRVVDE